METLEYSPKITYGGEAELMPINRKGGLTPMDKGIRSKVQQRAISRKDLKGNPMDVGYDSSEHLVEIGAGVYDNLPGMVSGLKETIIDLKHAVQQDRDGSILSMSHHPLEEPAAAYQRVIKKPMYDLLRGPYQGVTSLHESVLSKVY